MPERQICCQAVDAALEFLCRVVAEREQAWEAGTLLAFVPTTSLLGFFLFTFDQLLIVLDIADTDYAFGWALVDVTPAGGLGLAVLIVLRLVIVLVIGRIVFALLRRCGSLRLVSGARLVGRLKTERDPDEQELIVAELIRRNAGTAAAEALLAGELDDPYEVEAAMEVVHRTQPDGALAVARKVILEGIGAPLGPMVAFKIAERGNDSALVQPLVETLQGKGVSSSADGALRFLESRLARAAFASLVEDIAAHDDLAQRVALVSYLSKKETIPEAFLSICYEMAWADESELARGRAVALLAKKDTGLQGFPAQGS